VTIILELENLLFVISQRTDIFTYPVYRAVTWLHSVPIQLTQPTFYLANIFLITL